MSNVIHIGPWQFTPSTGTLSRDGKSCRLEKRAASLLEFFCQKEKDLVTHADIIEAIWNGRSVSPNSVAVVIADIRRAMGDDARDPEFIETLPKRGYRLIAPVRLPERHATEPPSSQDMTTTKTAPRRKALWAALATFAIAGVVFLLTQFRDLNTAAPQTAIAITQIDNRTEDPKYDPLTLALSELVSTELMRTGQYKITQPENADWLLSGSIILWNDHAAMSLRAQSTQDETTLWSGMAGGPENKLPGQVRKEIRELTDMVQTVGVGVE